MDVKLFDNKSNVENRINEFRREFLLKTQIMIRTNEPIHLIEEHVKELEVVWFGLCESVGMHQDCPVFHIETASEWISEWYQNLNRLRKFLNSGSTFAEYDASSNREEQPNQLDVQSVVQNDLTTPQKNFVDSSNYSKSRKTWAARTPANSNNNDFVPIMMTNLTTNSPNSVTFNSPSYINSPGMNRSTPLSAARRSPVSNFQTDLFRLFEQSKRNVDKIREQCKHTSIVLINQRCERDKAVAELDFVELKRSSANQEEYLHRGLALLEQIKEKYLNELAHLQACEEKFSRDLRAYTEQVKKHEVLSLKSMINTPRKAETSYYYSDSRTNPKIWPITPSQIEERNDQEELLNTFERLSNTISKNKARVSRTMEQLSQPDFDHQSPERQAFHNPPLLNRSLLPNQYEKDRSENDILFLKPAVSPLKSTDRTVLDNPGIDDAKRRIKDKMNSEKQEKGELDLKSVEKQRALDRVKESQKKIIEQSLLHQKSRDDLEHMLSDSIMELKRQEEEELNLEEEEILRSLKIDDARRTALRRAASARLKAEEEKRKEEERKEKKRRDAFKKRDERLDKFRIELALREEKRSADSLEQTPSKYSKVITNMS